MTRWCYLNGDWVPETEARIPVSDHGFLYGDGCFETVGAASGMLMHLDEHLARLARSARMLRIALPHEPDALRAIVLEAALRNGLDALDGSILRIVVTRGSGPAGVGNSNRLEHPTMVIIPTVPESPVVFDAPIPVVTAAMTSVERPRAAAVDPRVKNLNYMPSVLAYLEATDKGADIGIIRDAQGFIAEGHVANLFCVHGEAVFTPFARSALAGVTRGHVMASAQSLGLRCEERDLTLYDFVCADEAFCTGGTNVWALGAVDGHELTRPAPGSVTTRVVAAYRKAALADGTPIR